MKRILIIAGLCILTSAVHAQLIIGPELGVNVANFHMKYPQATFNNHTAAGLRGGLLVLVSADRQVSALTGLTYYSLGSNISFTQHNQYYASKVLIHTLQLPLFVHLQTQQRAHGRFFVGVGMVADYHLGGREYVGDQSTKLEIGNNTPGSFKTFDVGVGLDAGYRVVNGITIRAQYEFGLSNLSNAQQETINSRSFALTIAYLPLEGGKKMEKAKK